MAASVFTLCIPPTLYVCVYVQMTRVVLPGMEARKRGVIVNISSGARDILPPLDCVYGATKVSYFVHCIIIIMCHTNYSACFCSRRLWWLFLTAYGRNMPLEESMCKYVHVQ